MYDDNRLRERMDRNDYINWFYVSHYYKLSEDFIREFHNKVDWYCISKFQHLSLDFMREFRDRIDWHVVSFYQPLSEVIIREFYRELDLYVIGERKLIDNNIIDSLIVMRGLEDVG